MPEQDKTPSPEAQPTVDRSLTGSGALQLVQTVTENPTVAGVVAVAAAKVLLSSPKDPPPPPPPDPPAA